jgi:hypothetical protein
MNPTSGRNHLVGNTSFSQKLIALIPIIFKA